MKIEKIGTYWLPKGQGHYAQPREVKIVKIGRKYAHDDEGTRYEIETGRIVNFNGVGRALWPSEAAYESWAAGENAWRALMDQYRYRPPENLSVERVEEIRALIERPIA